MRIRRIRADWLHVPIAEEKQHTTDFGRIAAFDSTLVRVETEGGLVGFGEAKAAVGSAGTSAALVTCIEQELAPRIVGGDAGSVLAHWRIMRAAVRNIGWPGLAACAVSAVDVALWDLKARLAGLPLAGLLGGSRETVPVYGSGGFTTYDDAQLRQQLGGWAEAGCRWVKMKVGTEPARGLVVGGGASGSGASAGSERSAKRS